MEIDLSPVWQQISGIVATTVVGLVGAAVAWAGAKAAAWFQAKSDALKKIGFNDDALKAISYATELAKRANEKLGDPVVRAKYAEVAADYLRGTIPDKMKSLKINDARLADIVAARFDSPESAIPTIAPSQ